MSPTDVTFEGGALQTLISLVHEGQRQSARGSKIGTYVPSNPQLAGPIPAPAPARLWLPELLFLRKIRPFKGFFVLYT